MTQMPCRNLINPRPVEEHCPSRNMTENVEQEFAFEYKGHTFRCIKPYHECVDCATIFAKRWFDKFVDKLLSEKDGKIRVRWSYLKLLRRERKSALVRGFPQLDDEYQAIQLLHDLGFFTRDKSVGWDICERTGESISPSWYRRHELYFADLKDAIAYAKVCLKGWSFEIRKGDICYTSVTIFGA